MASQPKNKVKVLGLELGEIKEEEIENIAVKIEEVVRKYIDEKSFGLLEGDVLVKIEKDQNRLSIVIDVGVRGRGVGIDVEKLVRDSINVGRKEFEALIKKYVREPV
ncbi:hypothetical protein ACSU1N_03430 [Thermogladius sp. 4427co]|uniref:hypothetical protein n=1 Tax=Thermogladius sp. 4427co TaxID=3450718 RepID=UPI003F7B2E90